MHREWLRKCVKSKKTPRNNKNVWNEKVNWLKLYIIYWFTHPVDVRNKNFVEVSVGDPSVHVTVHGGDLSAP